MIVFFDFCSFQIGFLLLLPNSINTLDIEKLVNALVGILEIKWCPTYMFSLYTSQVGHQARTYLGFCSMKQLGEFLILPKWNDSLLQGYHQH